MFYYKIFLSGSDKITSVCDKEIVGQVFEDGDFILDVSKDFYGEKLANENQIKQILEDATIVNVAGKKIIDLLIREKMILPSSVILIGGVPHAQIIQI